MSAIPNWIRPIFWWPPGGRPLPPGDEHDMIHQIRDDLGIDARSFRCSHRFEDLGHTDFRTDEKTWREHGCIIFSHYYNTAEWIAREPAAAFDGEVVAVYAGAGKSGLFRGDAFNHVAREVIKTAVHTREIRLIVATDAACEGLNLQRLGTLINAVCIGFVTVGYCCQTDGAMVKNRKS